MYCEYVHDTRTSRMCNRYRSEYPGLGNSKVTAIHVIERLANTVRHDLWYDRNNGGCSHVSLFFISTVNCLNLVTTTTQASCWPIIKQDRSPVFISGFCISLGYARPEARQWAPQCSHPNVLCLVQSYVGQ